VKWFCEGNAAVLPAFATCHEGAQLRTRACFALARWTKPPCVTKRRHPPHPIAAATEWVAKITTVGLEMFLPAVAGAYVDEWLGTNYWALVGVVVGFVVGMWHLLQMTRTVPKGADKAESKRNNGGSAGV
jgi:F0F1-type ATP synthase assembly protein I